MNNEIEPEHVDTRRAGAIIGMSTSFLTKNRIYATGADRIPFIKIGAKVIYSVKALREYMAARQVGGK